MNVKKKILDCSFIPVLPWALLNPFYINRKLLAEAIQKVSFRLKGKILDLGCGSKPYKSFFSYEEYVGVDIENPGHPHTNENVDVFFDGKTLPFKDETFDSCFSTEVFEHVFEIDQTLAEIKRVLKTNGLIIVTTPFVWDEHEAPYDFCRYTSFGLKNVFERNGFEILSYSKLGTFYDLILQLNLIHANRIFGSNKILKYPFLLLLCPLLNLMSIFLNIFPSKMKTIYLGQIIVCAKR